MHIQENPLNALLQSPIQWREVFTDQSPSNPNFIAYYGNYNDMAISVEREIILGMGGVDVPTTLRVRKDNKLIVDLTGGFADQVFDRVLCEVGGESKTMALGMHFPKTHDGSSAIERLWTSLKHLSSFRSAQILEQVYEAVRHAPVSGSGNESWRHESYAVTNNSKPSQLINAYTINFNGLEIRLETSPARVEDLQTIVTGVKKISYECKIVVRNESQEVLFSEDDVRPASMIRILENRHRAFRSAMSDQNAL